MPPSAPDDRQAPREPTTTPMSDEESVRVWREFLTGANPHGHEAFERLYAAFLPSVLRYCRFRMRDGRRGEDIAQAVFVRLLATRPELRSSFTGLLFTTARNMCTAELATHRPAQHRATHAEDALPDDGPGASAPTGADAPVEPRAEPAPTPSGARATGSSVKNESPDDTSDPSRHIERAERHAALADCIARLPSDDQTLLVLHEGDGMTYRQIADVLSQSVAPSTFTRRLKRIKALLLRCLKEKMFSRQKPPAFPVLVMTGRCDHHGGAM